jgi:hypothetical protein
MRYVYALIITMLIGGGAVTDGYAQRGNGRTTTSNQSSDNDTVSRGTGARSSTAGTGRGNGRTSESAQGRTSDSRTDGSVWDVILGDGRDDDWDDDDDRNGNGPPFCENGQGHPVHGRQWCRDKGWPLGGNGPIWRDRRSDDDVIFRIPRGDQNRSVAGSILDDILGRNVYNQLDGHRQTANLAGALTGYWLDYGRNLQVRSGGVPLAEFRDVDGDGRVDAVRFNDRRY